MNDEYKKTMLDMARAASTQGEIISLPPTKHCGCVWSSDPNILQEDKGGWTRLGGCGLCGASLEVKP